VIFWYQFFMKFVICYIKLIINIRNSLSNKDDCICAKIRLLIFTCFTVYRILENLILRHSIIIDNQTKHIMSQLYDRFLAFFNGMVGGTLQLNQDGHKSLSCSPFKSSRFVYRHNQEKILSTLALEIA
jgi:hypothetical protein